MNLVVIPARLQSSRLPQKPLLDIHGLPLIVHVYKRCSYSHFADKVIVATDSIPICDVLKSYDIPYMLTADSHICGTDRVAEVSKYMPEYENIVNVQGDEALINPDYIDLTFSRLSLDGNFDCSILVNKSSRFSCPSDIKVVFDIYKNVMYLSREDIPSSSRSEVPYLFKAYHVVGFKRSFLMEYTTLAAGKLELTEFNEYLRILEHGRTIRAIEVASDAISVDTPSDLDYVREHIISDPLFLKYINS